MKGSKRTPSQIGGIAFLLTILVPIIIVAVATLMPPESLPQGTGNFIDALNTAACPAALAIGAIAYFWARSQQ